MTTSRAWGLILGATLCACDSSKSSETGEQIGDTTGSSTDSGSESGTDSGSESGTETAETSSGGPEDSDGPPTPADFTALCEQQTDRGACEAVPGEYYPWEDQTMWCAWWVEVPVELVGDACNFGQAQARCEAISASEAGCGNASNACQAGEVGWSRVVGEDLLIGSGSACTSEIGDLCDVDAQGAVNEGVPECACLCDPAFPS